MCAECRQLEYAHNSRIHTGGDMTAVQYQVRDNVAEIMLDNAPVNALDEEVIDALLAALARARDDSSARAVILGSAIAGRFCAGLQLDLFRRGEPAQIR